MRMRAITGLAEFARFMPMNSANDRKCSCTAGPQNARGSA